MDLSGVTLLQIIPKLVGGGAERTTLEVGRAFVAAGGRSLVASSGGLMVEELEEGGSTHIDMPLDSKNPLLMAQNARDLAALIEADGISIVHARSRAPAWSALSAARRTKRPFVTTYHGVYSAKSGLKRLYNSVMVRADHVIANSAFTADHVRREYEGKRYFHPSNMTVIPRGADLSRFDPARISEERIETFRALFGPGLRVLLPGRFTPWKGQDVLVRAAKVLAEVSEREAYSFIAIGRMDEKQDYVDQLRLLVDQAGLNSRFQLLDATEDMPAMLRAADVVVSASTRPEAFGRVAVEAQAAGRPIIATAHGGALETVLEGETGYLVTPDDPEALAKAIGKVNDQSSGEREAMGERGMAHARKKFTTEAMTSATLMIYQKVLAQQGDEW